MGATWLGGMATYTIARDQCTKTVLYPSVTIARCVHLVLWFMEYTFLWFMLSLECLFIMLDELSFDVVLIVMISMW